MRAPVGRSAKGSKGGKNVERRQLAEGAKSASQSDGQTASASPPIRQKAKNPKKNAALNAASGRKAKLQRKRISKEMRIIVRNHSVTEDGSGATKLWSRQPAHGCESGAPCAKQRC